MALSTCWREAFIPDGSHFCFLGWSCMDDNRQEHAIIVILADNDIVEFSQYSGTRLAALTHAVSRWEHRPSSKQI
jgi:hypothetical protein